MNNFESEVAQNRPRLALVELIPIIRDLASTVSELSAKVEALESAKTTVVKEKVVEEISEEKPKETPKETPVKKTASKKKIVSKKAASEKAATDS